MQYWRMTLRTDSEPRHSYGLILFQRDKTLISLRSDKTCQTRRCLTTLNFFWHIFREMTFAV